MADPTRYIIVNQLDYETKRGPRTAHPGEVISDLPADSVPWLLEQGHIVPADTTGG